MICNNVMIPHAMKQYETFKIDQALFHLPAPVKIQKDGSILTGFAEVVLVGFACCCVILLIILSRRTSMGLASIAA